MKQSKIVIILVLLLSATGSSYSQKRVQEIIDFFGRTAYAYFLSANRPAYGINAYVTEKGRLELSSGVSFNDEIFEIPFGISYGVSRNFEFSTGISAYTQSYKFSGEKVGGLGDSYLASKFKFQESENFIHAVQGLIKIPTASKDKQLGTGRVDFYFGLAQGFYSNRFGYDLSAELNFLHRRDYPQTRQYLQYFENIIDSLKKAYNYTYETELVISGGPSYDFSDNFSVYTGVSFSRNFKLDYNSTQIYGGFGFLASNNVILGLGASYGLDKAGSWLISSNFIISL
ncbi:MAG: hypothetical protein L0Y77_13345 [Chlorobi bacterium]|nr:hypothetical protein [Chlorobiota bacterium]